MPKEKKIGRNSGVGVGESADADGAAADAAPSVEELIVGPNSEATPVLSVVMPTMNEAAGIDTCFDWIETAVRKLGAPTEILISDSSDDRTPEIARERGAIVVEPDEPGYGYAYRYAFERVRGEYVVMGDADSTYDFSEIPRLLDQLEAQDADIVMGSRLEGDIKPGAMPALHRYVGNPLLTGFLNTFYDAGVSDAHSGFRVFHADVIEAIDLKSDGMEFASEMVMKAGAESLHIEEVPITYHERAGEATLESFRDGWRHVRFMLLNAPGYLFSIPGGVFSAVGILTLLLSLVGTQFSGVFFGIHTAIVGSLLTIVGFQVSGLAVFSAVTTDPIQAPTDTVTQLTRDRIRLEHGVLFGIICAGSGGTYFATVFTQWLAASSSVALAVVPNLIAFTAAVVGVQSVFSSFFLSMIAGDTCG
jgi:glycosyltransferase involved in cell wall biosynthesis